MKTTSFDTVHPKLAEGFCEPHNTVCPERVEGFYKPNGLYSLCLC